MTHKQEGRKGREAPPFFIISYLFLISYFHIYFVFVYSIIFVIYFPFRCFFKLKHSLGSRYQNALLIDNFGWNKDNLASPTLFMKSAQEMLHYHLFVASSSAQN